MTAWLRSLLIGIALSVAPAGAAPSDVEAVSALLKQIYDNKDSPLTLSPVVVVDEWSLAGWTQGEMGGLAVVRKIDGAWSLRFCAGAEVVNPAALARLGVPVATAERLAASMTEAETRESHDRVAKFALFQGVVDMAPKP